MDVTAFISKHLAARAYSLYGGDRLYARLRKLECVQWLPPDEIRKIQIKRLKRMLVHAYESVPYYEDSFSAIGFDPYKFCELAQLQELPLLRKTDIVHNYNELVSSRYDKKLLLESSTGGSTGTQLHFSIDKSCVDERNACAWRHNRWAGWDIGMPVAALWGNPKKAVTLKAKSRRLFLNRLNYLDTMDMSPVSMKNFAQVVNGLGGYALYGHAHSLYLFAKFIMDEKFVIHRPRAIVSTSMMLMKNERSVIEEAFGVNVTDRYGCEEVGLIASECEIHGAMHLNVDHLVVEFLRKDGSYAASGEEGRIVVTDLMNLGMPFIRYEVGDIGIPTERICTCGRGLPLMEKVSGRTADFLVRRDASLVAGVSLVERFLTNIPGIHQMQIVQDYPDKISIRLVKGREFSKALSITQLRKEFDEVFPGTEMQYEFWEKIPQESSGKYRFAICNIGD